MITICAPPGPPMMPAAPPEGPEPGIGIASEGLLITIGCHYLGYLKDWLGGFRGH